MAISNPSTSISTTSSISNITSANSVKVSTQQSSSIISTVTSFCGSDQNIEHINLQSVSKKTFANVASAVPLIPKLNKPTTTVITIATSTITSLQQPAKTSLGKHHLPVKPLPIASLTHVAPKSSASTTNSVLDSSCGNCIAKPVTIHPTILANQLPQKSKTSQHYLVAPGLRTHIPTLKHSSYSPTYTYHLPNNASITSVPNNIAAVTVTTSKAHVLVRPIIAAPSNRAFVPLAIATSSEPNKHLCRLTSVLQHPTSTISISIPAKSSSQIDVSNASRLSVTSAQSGKALYQVGTSQSTSSLGLSSVHKSPKFISSSHFGSVPVCRNYYISVSSSTPVTSTVFGISTASSSKLSSATITTSAVSVAKVIPSQSTSKTHAVHPHGGEFSTHRSNEVLTASLGINASCQSLSVGPLVVASLANQKATTQESIVSAFWQPTSIAVSSALCPPLTSFLLSGETNLRSKINATETSSAALSKTQVRPNQSNLQDGTTITSAANAALPAFTQGQILHSTSLAGCIKDQPRHPHQSPHSTTFSSNTLNSSPKPAILRRQRTDNKQPIPQSTTKKLIFDTHNHSSPKSENRAYGLDVISLMERSTGKQGYVRNDQMCPLSKSELSNSGNFVKTVTHTNGLSSISKHSLNKDCSSFTLPKEVKKDHCTTHLVHQAKIISDIKVKKEPGSSVDFKIDSASKYSSQIHSAHHQMLLNKDYPSSKISIMHSSPGEFAGMVPQTQNSLTIGGIGPLSVVAKLGSPKLSHQGDAKSSSSCTLHSNALKRDYEKIFGDGKQTITDDKVALSPRKKPRKQTHIVAEELSDAEHDVEAEITDDAEECEDEVPLATLVKDCAAHKISSNSTCNSFCNDIKLATINEQTLTEFVDKDGVRYASIKKRPSISLLNGHRFRPVVNHFIHYSDFKVKEKKLSLHDTLFNEKYMKGWKVLQFASQFDNLASLDDDLLQRIEIIKEGILQHVSSLLSNENLESGEMSPGQKRHCLTLSTPCLTSSQTKGFASFVKSLPPATNNNASFLNTSITSCQKKSSRLRDEVLKIDDKAQANIQRCKVLQEQLGEAKDLMVIVLKHRKLVTQIVQVARDTHKPHKIAFGNGSRNSKKKRFGPQY